MAGFAFSDCTKNGFSVVVTARNGNRARAREVANLLSSRTWAIREEFNRRMMGVEDAVKLAVTAGTYEDTPSILLADVADNPGGAAAGTPHIYSRHSLPHGQEVLSSESLMTLP